MGTRKYEGSASAHVSMWTCLVALVEELDVCKRAALKIAVMQYGRVFLSIFPLLSLVFY